MSQIIKNMTSGIVPPQVATSYVENSGTAVPALNILDVPGNNTANNGFATWTIGSGNQLLINSYGTAKWVVNPIAGVGTHQTITAAIASASAGDTIFVTANASPYIENPTLKNGINIVGFTGDGNNNVTIKGTVTITSGVAYMANVMLEDNGSNALVVSGSAATTIDLDNVVINALTSTGINFSNSNSASQINVYQSQTYLNSTFGLYTMSSPGTLSFYNCQLFNNSSTTTASSNSAGQVNSYYCYSNIAFSTSGTGIYIDRHSYLDTSKFNATTLTTAGTASQNALNFTQIISGTASAISVGTGTTVSVVSGIINSSNTNVITGLGSLFYGDVTFTGASSGVNTSSITTYPWPTVQGGTGRATLTNHGVLIGAGTSAITQLAAGTSGQVLQSGGASADPSYSTATYPSTAGTSGNVLTSDGTNWNSSTAPTGTIVLTSSTLWSNAALKAGTSLQLVAAPAAGIAVVPISIVLKLEYGGTNAFTNEPAWDVCYGSVNGTSVIMNATPATFWAKTVNTTYLNILTSTLGTNYQSSVMEATGVFATLSTGLTGNAAGDNTVKIVLAYYLVNVG